MTDQSRPLSPHLSVYRPQITSAMSILHRITGVALSVGTLALVWWIAAAAIGDSAFANAQAALGSWLGQILLFGWTLALFYHLFNGVRHLGWDAGYGFELPNVLRSGVAVFAIAGLLTVALWIAAYSFA